MVAGPALPTTPFAAAVTRHQEFSPDIPDGVRYAHGPGSEIISGHLCLPMINSMVQFFGLPDE
jgi:hypothetical protein